MVSRPKKRYRAVVHKHSQRRYLRTLAALFAAGICLLVITSHRLNGQQGNPSGVGLNGGQVDASRPPPADAKEFVDTIAKADLTAGDSLPGDPTRTTQRAGALPFPSNYSYPQQAVGDATKVQQLVGTAYIWDAWAVEAPPPPETATEPAPSVPGQGGVGVVGWDPVDGEDGVDDYADAGLLVAGQYYSPDSMSRLLAAAKAGIAADMESRQHVGAPQPRDSVPQRLSVSPECWDATSGQVLSEYCSLGHVKPFIGCIDDVASTRAALDARAYRNEIVVMVADKGHLEVTLNAVLTLQQRGFGHYLLLMPSQEDCTTTAALVPRLGCVWSDMFSHVPEVPTWLWHKVRRIWMLRWMLFARLLQLGTNVLMMDTDNVMLYDFYSLAKGPMFGAFNLMLPQEPTLPGINAGAVYAQNCHQAGPVAWMAAEVADRTMRAVDDFAYFLNHVPPWGGDRDHVDLTTLYEQNLLNDAACSAAVGRPVMYHTLMPRKQADMEAHQAWHDLHAKLCRPLREMVVAVPQAWQEIIQVAEWKLPWMPLWLPRLPGAGATAAPQWPPEIAALGGPPFKPARGPRATELRRWLEAAAPLWPDPEAADPRQLRTALPPEALLVSPGWFMGRFGDKGSHGWWDAAYVAHPAIVLGHLIVPATPLIDTRAKIGTLKVYAWWHWSASYLLNPQQPLPIYSSRSDPGVVPLLVVAPWVNMVTPTEAVFFWLVHHLLRVALLAERVLVWPHYHCLAPWTKLAQDWDPAVIRHPILTRWTRVYGGLHNTRCMHMALMNQGCEKVAIQQYDFMHLLTRLPGHAASPSVHNTFNMPTNATTWPLELDPDTWKPPTELQKGVDYPHFETPVVLDATWLQRELVKYNAQPVLYLGSTLVVRDLPVVQQQQLDEAREQCQLRWLWQQHMDAWWEEPVARFVGDVVGLG